MRSATLVAPVLTSAVLAFSGRAVAQTPPPAATTPAAPAPAPAPAAPTAPPAPAAPAPPAAPSPAAAPAPAAQPPAGRAPSAVDIATLQSLRERGVLSQAEYEQALRDIGASTGAQQASEANSLVVGKWVTTLYGFIEGDAIYDTTESFRDLAGNAQVLRPGGAAPPEPASPETYGGDHGQTQFSVRNTRFGLRLRPPGTETVHTSGMLEMDFLGNQPTGISEASYFTSPTLRVRHAMFRVETPVVDVLVGQYWHLFGWQGTYHPNTVEIQGVPGELYARTPQIRISKRFEGSDVTVEAAVAAMRPPAAGSELPEGTAGVRVAANKWTGMQTMGATATSIMPASIAITGDYRHFEVPDAGTLVPSSMVHVDSGAVAANAFLPVLPARVDKRDNALSLTGEFVYGYGIGDLYTNLNSGVQFPNIPNLTGLANVPTWPQNVDNGLVAYDLIPPSANTPSGAAGSLHPIQWTSFIVGAQYYFPGLDGRAWISANYSHMESQNTADFARSGPPNPQQYYYQTSAAQIRKGEDWFDVNLFFDPLASVRVGLEGAAFYDHYADGVTAINYRGQASGFFLF
jgi:hypothetical protein